jgi:hypothetical protein
MAAEPDSVSYLAADAVVRGLLRVVSMRGEARIVASRDAWTLYQKGADGAERPIASTRELWELVREVGKMVAK